MKQRPYILPLVRVLTPMVPRTPDARRVLLPGYRIEVQAELVDGA